MKKTKLGPAGSWRRVATAVAVALAVMGVTIVGVSSPAAATGVNCARWGFIEVDDHSIPTGQYCFSVSGSGLVVTSTGGSFNKAWISKPVETVRFYDKYGRQYASWTTYRGVGTVYGFHDWTTRINGNAKAGRACGTLSSLGEPLATACVRIIA